VALAAIVVLGPTLGPAPAGADSPGSEPVARDANGSIPPTVPGLRQLVQEQAKALGNRWAGSSVQDDGTALVGLTAGPVPAALASTPNVRVVTRRFSVARLDVAMERVVERLNPLLNPRVAPGTPGKWPYEARVDLEANVVHVVVDRTHQAKEARIKEALADEISSGVVRYEFGTTKHVSPASCLGPYVCHSPWRAGTKIDDVNGVGCTPGFVMKNPDGVRYQSTAGHCGPGPFSHNGVQIGFTAWARDSGNVDARIVQQNNQSQNAPRNWVFESGTDNALPVTSKVTSSYGTSGDYLCKHGYYGRKGCGLLTHENVSFLGRSGFGLFRSTNTCHGDSGAPVYLNYDISAYGMLAGAGFPPGEECGSNIDTYFSWIFNIEAASGYQVLLTPTTQTLGPGQRMHGGDSIRSTNGTYALNMQTDGNLVLYGPTGLVWAADTVGHAGAFVTMQNAGNLVVYSATNVPLWARPSSGYLEGSRLVLQNDRNLVIYSPGNLLTWATNTNI
jgi:hypothetical protein